jgi:hypothetical protein
MNFENRVDRMERRLATGEVDVVFIISDDGRTPEIARINGEEFARHESETLQSLADRALRAYRSSHAPTEDVSVLIMDCRAETSFTGQPPSPFQDLGLGELR